jgi:hypothetical protein
MADNFMANFRFKTGDNIQTPTSFGPFKAKVLAVQYIDDIDGQRCKYYLRLHSLNNDQWHDCEQIDEVFDYQSEADPDEATEERHDFPTPPVDFEGGNHGWSGGRRKSRRKYIKRKKTRRIKRRKSYKR